MTVSYAPIIDYLVDGYGVRRSDVAVLYGGKHARARFPLGGKTYSVTLPLSPSDTNWVRVKLGDVRRLLGPPSPAPAGRTRDSEHRTLDSMIPAVPPVLPSAPADTDVGAAHPQLPIPRYPARAALVASNRSLELSLPREVVDAFFAGWDGPRGVRVGFTAPDLWTLRHSRGDSPAIVRHDARLRLRCGGGQAYERLGAFFTTPAEAWLEGGCVLVRLTESPRKTSARRTPSVPQAQAVNGSAHPAVDAPAGPVPAPTQGGDVVVPLGVEPRLRAALAEVRAIHAETPYRLFNVAGEWVFRAVVEVR